MSALAGGRPVCLLHDKNRTLAREAALSVQIVTPEDVSVLWNLMNSSRNFNADAIPNNSALVELFWLIFPSTGPEQAAVCLGIELLVLVVCRVRANEHLESDSIDPSVAIWMLLRPS